MVTYMELFTFVIMITGVIALVIDIILLILKTRKK